VGVKCLGGEKGARKEQGIIILFLWTGKRKSTIGNMIYCTPQDSIRVKRVEFISDMSYIVQRGRWCNIVVLNVRAPSEEKSDDSEDS